MLAAVRRSGGALQWASRPLRADVEVVRAAVAQHGRALRHAGKASRGPQSYSCFALYIP